MRVIVRSPPPLRLPQFGLPVVLEAVAGTALAMAVLVELGPWGLLIIWSAAGLLLIVSCAWGPPRLNMTPIEILTVVGICLVVVWLMFPAVQAGHPPLEKCRRNLSLLGEALLEYRDERGAYPPAVVRDATGRPTHGWQVYLLPLLDQQDLFDEYDFTAAWNLPANLAIGERPQWITACPMLGGGGSGSALTSYFYVVGAGRWAADQPPRLAEMNDGPEQTILLVETRDVTTSWTEPAPLTVEAFLELAGSRRLTVHGIRLHEWGPWREGVHVLMADGTPRLLRTNLDEATWRALLTPNGGEQIDWDDILLDKVEPPTARMIVLAAGFVLIVAR